MDTDPFEPTGISLETSRFLDAFLLFCALDDSPCTSEEESIENVENFARAVKEGRRPGLELQHNGAPVTLQTWGLDLLEHIARAATLLDAQRDDHQHGDALEQQRRKLHHPELTPSARVLAEMAERKETFAGFALRQSKAHAAAFRARPPSAEEHAYFTEMAAKSLLDQEQIERTQTGDFDTFVAAYRASTLGNMSI